MFAKTAASVVIFAAICSLAALSAPQASGDMEMAPWYSIVPPLLIIISSVASRCDHLQHVRTQMPYSLFVAVLALVCGYVPAGLGLAPHLSFMIAIGVMLTVFLTLLRLTKKTRGTVEDPQ